MPCCCRKYTACESFSPKMATSTLAPVTSFLPEDCTCRMARWMTRWKPSVGCVSTSRSAAMRGVCSAMCCVRFLRSSSMLAPQARNTSAAVGLSSSASSRCSTVMNSWRFWRASTNAMWRLTSSSWAIICCLSSCLPLTPFPPHSSLSLFHHTLQRVLMLPGVCRDLLHLGGSNVAGIDPTDPDAFAMHLQHHLRGPFPAHAEELLQHHHNELHGGVVVVQQHDLEHRRRLQLAALGLQYGVVLLLRHAADYAPSSPPESDKFRACPFPQAYPLRFPVHPLAIPRTIVIFVGGRSNPAGSAERRNYGVFSRPWRIFDSGLALTPHSLADPLTRPCRARKRRAVFGFRLSVCHPGRRGRGVPGMARVERPVAHHKYDELGRAHGNRDSKVVQRRERLRIYHAGRRQRGSLRPLFRHQHVGLQDPERGPEGEL